ncbi:MAG TPA: hypothetical protein PLQ56_08895 [Aggregatilineales bacterium]|nr:hypothetical protein [Aggregatilineales bacterium]
MPARPRRFYRLLVELTLIGICVSLLALPTAAQSTPTPEPTLTPTSIPDPNLLLIAQPESLTLVVTAQTVNLTGFGFGVLVDGGLIVINLTDRVDALVLLRNIAPMGACFQLVLSGETPVLPSACTNRSYLYRVQVAAADQFWYDRLGNQLRDVGIVSAGELTGELCSGALLEVGCEIVWDLPETAITVPTIEVTILPTSTLPPQLMVSPSSIAMATPRGAVCFGVVVSDGVASLLNIVRERPSAYSRLVNVLLQPGDTLFVRRKSMSEGGWYELLSSDGDVRGWIPQANLIFVEPCSL